jgi:hypothetical protein
MIGRNGRPMTVKIILLAMLLVSIAAAYHFPGPIAARQRRGQNLRT